MRPSVQVILKLPCTPIIQRYALIKIWHLYSKFNCWKIRQVVTLLVRWHVKSSCIDPMKKIDSDNMIY